MGGGDGGCMCERVRETTSLKPSGCFTAWRLDQIEASADYLTRRAGK